MLCCLAWAFLSAKVTKPLVVERIELCPEEGKSNLYIFTTFGGDVVNSSFSPSPFHQSSVRSEKSR